jgi:predicted Zn finger-like uncharacterized protein
VVVQCPTCSSKFRIADEKVTDRGVKVRCTSCKKVFQVRKSGAAPAEPPPPPPDPAPEQPPRDPPRTDAARRPRTGPIAVRQPTGPITVRPPTGPIPVPRPAADGAARRVEPDLFGLDELTGDAPPSPVRAVKTAMQPAPNFDDIELEVKTDPEAQARSQPKPPQRTPESLLPPSESGQHMMLGAVKVGFKDPFEGMDMGEPGTGAIELATQPKRDKLAEAVRAEMAERARTEAAERAKAAETSKTAERAEPQVPDEPAPPEEAQSGRGLVSSVLTGLLGAAVAIAVVFVSALKSDAAAGWLGLGPANDVVATRVVSGVYDTASGKQVFYVRGRIENHGAKVRGPVHVTAELLADGAPDGRAEAIVGAEPSPEDVWSLKSTADAEKLVHSLETIPIDRKLQPGASLPFFVVMTDPPQDLQNRRLRVRVETPDAWVPPAKGKGR